MLITLLEIEIKFNRIRLEKWGPRTLDLDLLLYDDLILETPTLTLPHPRMTERAFVLVPLAEIAPDWVHPVTEKCDRPTPGNGKLFGSAKNESVEPT